jgi:hypothetical protein
MGDLGIDDPAGIVANRFVRAERVQHRVGSDAGGVVEQLPSAPGIQAIRSSGIARSKRRQRLSFRAQCVGTC